MKSPFYYFRKNQKILLAVFGVLLMIAFVALPPILDMMARGGFSGADDRDKVYVKWKAGKLKESELDALRRRHTVVMAYLRELMQIAQRETGKRVEEFELANPGGLPGVVDDQGMLRMVLLAEQAEQAGVRIDEDAVLAFLRRLSGEASEAQLLGVLRKNYGRELTMNDVVRVLGRALAAREMEKAMLVGMRAAPPSRAIASFARFKREVAVEAVPLKVADFVKKVADPSEKELKKLYEEYKTVANDPLSPEPGFRRRYKATFHYFMADPEAFLERASKNVTEEEIEAYYKENKEIRFRERDIDFDDLEFPPSDEPPADEPPADEPPADEPPADEPPADEPPADETPADETPADETPDDETPDDDGAGGPSPTDRRLFVSADDPFTDDDESPTEEADDPEASDSEVDEDASVSEARSPEPPTEPEPREGAPEAPAAHDKNDDESAAEPESEEEATPSEETTPPADRADGKETPPAEDGHEEPPATRPSTPDGASGEKPDEPAPPKYKPLDEVRDTIRRDLATQKASQDLEAAIEKMKAEMSLLYTRYEKAIAERVTQGMTEEVARAQSTPKLESLKKLGEGLGLTFGVADMVDRISVSETPLGKAEQVNREMVLDRSGRTDQQQAALLTVADVAFGDDQMPLFRAQVFPQQDVSSQMLPNGMVHIVSQEPYRDSKRFVFWKVKAQEPQIPDFDEIRDEVERAWNMRQAFDLALKKAKELAETAEEAQTDLAGAFGETQQVITTAPFTYYDLRARQPQVSQVAGVDDIGDDFMQTVMDLDPGEVAVAANVPRTMVYVVRLKSASPTRKELRESFMTALTPLRDEGRVEPRLTPLVLVTVQQELLDFREDAYNDLMKSQEVRWLESPRPATGRR